jgi:hypothetical protein
MYNGRLILLILLLLIPTVKAQYSCHACTAALKLHWPLIDDRLAEGRRGSICDSEAFYVEQFGLDLYAAHGDNVMASFEGTIEMIDDCGVYGRGVKLTSTDGNHIAFYGYLQDKGRGDGETVAAGDVIGAAMGMGYDPDCPSLSPGSSVYFEMFSNLPGVGWQPVDPRTCVPNSCNFWYTVDGSPGGAECVPNFEGSTSCLAVAKSWQGGFDWPSYACGPPLIFGGSNTHYFAEITIDEYGKLDVSCDDNRCMSEVYDKDMRPMIKNSGDRSYLNCFIRFLRVYNDGEVWCGIIQPNGAATPHMVMGPDGIIIPDSPCNQYPVVSLGIAGPIEAKTQGYTELKFLKSAANPEKEFGSVVISSEYEVLGVDDRDYINKIVKHAYLHADEDKRGFNPALHDGPNKYYTDFILTRKCDIGGIRLPSKLCKNHKLPVSEAYDKDTPDYNGHITLSGYESCTYDVHDAGKFYDEPGYYISTNWMSPFASLKGMRFYW